MLFTPSIDDPNYKVLVKSINTYVKTISLNISDIALYIMDTLLLNKELIKVPYINTMQNTPFLKYNRYVDKNDNLYLKKDIDDLDVLLELLETVDSLMPVEDNGAVISVEDRVLTKNKLIYLINNNTLSMYLDPGKTASDIVTILAKYNLVSLNKQKEYIWESLTPIDQNILLEDTYYNDENYPELYLIENLYKPLTDLNNMLNEANFMLGNRIINNKVEKEITLFSVDTFMVDRLTLGINVHQGYPALRAMVIKKLRDTMLGGKYEKINNSDGY